MKKKIFYIYEVKGIKNGCTTQWDKRSEQNFKKYNIMPVIVETYEYPNTAEYWQIVGDREWELAELNGYPKGTHYRTAMEQRSIGGKLGGKIAVESGHLKSVCSMGGKIPSYHLRKLTFEDVQTIRELYSTKKYTQRKLAKMFSISQSQISVIVNNKNWKHI